MFSYQKKGSYTYGSRDSVTSLFLSKLILHLLYFCNSFLIMFILFHSAVYDDIIGCQNLSAINTPIAKAVEKMKITRNLLYITKLSRQFLICALRKILTMKKLSLNTNTVRMLVLNMFRDIFSLNLFSTI